MRLLGRNTLQDTLGHDSEVDRWLNNWMSELSTGRWKAQVEVAKRYPRAQVLGEGHICFRVGDTALIVEVFFCFRTGIAMINGLRNG